jgi:hypothetical protein
MLRRFAFIGGVLILASANLPADFSYQQKSTITGGMMASAMKVAGVFSKQAREPMVTTVSVKGDRMLHRGPTHLEIIDLGSETFTNVDLQKKTYSTMTFAEFKQMMEQMQQNARQQKGNGTDVQFKVSAENTGATRTIAGVEAKETVIKMEMQGTDQQSGQSGSMVVTTDAWIAPAAPGYKEIRDFYRRMAEKLDWAPGGNLFAGRADISKGMAESMKQVGALDGMPVFEIMSMGATGAAGNQPAADPKQQQQSAPPSVGSVLGGRFGLGRKKEQPQQQQSADQPAAPAGAPNSLLEMKMEMNDFSAAPVDDSQFAVPAGFKQVQPDTRRAR